MGKGFGYVNFETDSSVDIALQKNGSILLGRSLRVGRAVRKPKPVLQFVEKDKKPVLGKKLAKTVPSTKRVVKTTKKKIREKQGSGSSFQGQKSDEPPKIGKAKKKKPNKGLSKKKVLAKKLLSSGK